MFKFAYNIANRVSPPKEFKIATGTAVTSGQLVQLSVGQVIDVAAPTDLDDPVLGVTAETHDGATADGRQTGTKINVYADPSDIFELTPRNVITATGGSTTTFVDSNILPATDDVFNEGYIEIKTCAANSSLVGKRVKIADFTGSTGTFTLAETLPSALASGDTAYLCPGPYAIGLFGWDSIAAQDDVDFESSGGETLQLYGTDPEQFKTFWKLRLHTFGNDSAAK